MSFSSEVKAEMCRKKPDKKCCSIAESYGVLLYCNTFSASEIRIITASAEFAERLPHLFKKAFGLSFDVLPKENPGGKYSFRITDPQKLETIFHTFGSEPEDVLSNHVNYGVIEEDCCRLSFLRGAFLAGGSVTDPEKHYHLEFMTSHRNVCSETEPLLREFDFPVKSASRESGYMLYFKQADTISDLITLLGAPVSAMNVITAKVEKGMRNTVTRKTNCDTANIDKTVAASQSQIDSIHRYAREYGLSTLPDELRDIAILRITNPESSLTELAKLSDPHVSRSCIAYRLKKISEYIPQDE